MGAGNWGTVSSAATLKQSELGLGLSFELSKPSSSDVIPPARPRYVPNTNTWEPSVQTSESTWRHFSLQTITAVFKMPTLSS